MEREQELKKLINVLHRTTRAALRVQWMQVGEGETRFAVEQFNRILARLGELDPNVKTVFAPLPPESSLTTVALACRQVVSYFEDEVRVSDDWGRHGGFAAGFKVPCGEGKDFTLEDLGNFIRDRMQEIFQEPGSRKRGAERKPCG
jgi:hypothetical protein